MLVRSFSSNLMTKMCQGSLIPLTLEIQDWNSNPYTGGDAAPVQKFALPRLHVEQFPLVRRKARLREIFLQFWEIIPKLWRSLEIFTETGNRPRAEWNYFCTSKYSELLLGMVKTTLEKWANEILCQIDAMLLKIM
jgi:hypothetical protein